MSLRLLLAGALVAVGLLTGCESDEPYVAPTSTPSTDSIAPATAAATLDSLQTALRREDAAAAAALGADDAASAVLRSVVATATTLELEDVTFRYVAENGQIAPDGTWTAAVATTWRVTGFDPTSARAEVEFAFAEDGTRIRTIGGAVGSTPVWLGGVTAARRTDDVALVLAQDALPLRPLRAQAEEALAVVRRVLGPRADRLVVEVPASGAALHAALGLPPGTYDAVAAVTTSADGANVPGSPVHVFLNPDVFGGLGPLAAQIVMSHEAVHALTSAPTVATAVEPWLLEGFADYVALRDVDLPVSRTAGQVIAQVREHGVPTALPSRVELGTTAEHLGAAYEAAWLVCVTLAEHGGEEALVRFYDAVIDGADLEVALRQQLGWTIGDLTRAWQERLADIAGAGRG